MKSWFVDPATSTRHLLVRNTPATLVARSEEDMAIEQELRDKIVELEARIVQLEASAQGKKS